MRHFIHSWVVVALAFAANVCQADEIDPVTDLLIPDTRLEITRLKIFVSPEFLFVMGNSRNAAGYGVGGGVSLGLSAKWAVAASMRQSFYFGGTISPMFGQIDLRGVYALTGTVLKEQRRVTLGRQTVLTADSPRASSLQLHFSLAQYLFNADAAIVQLVGAGAGLVYEFPWSGDWNFQVGARIDAAINKQYFLLPIQVSFGMSMWL